MIYFHSIRKYIRHEILTQNKQFEHFRDFTLEGNPKKRQKYITYREINTIYTIMDLLYSYLNRIQTYKVIFQREKKVFS